MLAAVAGVPYHVTFRGPMYFNFAADAAAAFIAAARYRAEEPLVLNIPGTRATVEELVQTIQEIVPTAKGTITVSDVELASPSAVDASRTRTILGLGKPTPFREGVAKTMDILREGLSRGLLQAPVG
jgi:nucleoside-diphosphate-sugar epimerase